jgi:tellurite resistance protein TehA-like permease
MAAGIVSVAALQHRAVILSQALLAVACLAWLVLTVVVCRRASTSVPRRPPLHSLAAVAASAVIGARLALAGEATAALACGIVAVGLWFVLLARRPTIIPARGSSLLLVVASESLAVLAALLAPQWGRSFLFVALAYWVLGLVLYPLVIAAIVRTPLRGRRFDPDLWIVVGALAIATLAGTDVLLSARVLGMFHQTVGWLRDADLATWSAASALVMPLLLAELRTRSQWRYEASRWSFVFPLGMYAVASRTLHATDNLSALQIVSDVFFAVALVAWLVVLLGLTRATVATWRR